MRFAGRTIFRLVVPVGIGAVALSIICLDDSRVTSAADDVERVPLEPAKPQRPVSLRDRLIVGLQARLKSEIAFVDLVVLRVRLGQLPQRVVDETFFWARDRASVPRSGRTRRPIIYFQPAMVARAQRLRVTL
jgi:hypothetical protein